MAVDYLDSGAKASILNAAARAIALKEARRTPMSTSQAAQRQLRGSQKLLEGLTRNEELPSLDEIKKAVALPASLDYKVLNWQIRGIPPAYLEWETTLQVKPADVAQVVSHFVALNDSTIGLRILTNGIPFPEIANITITNGGPGE
jgi:hypothetical protein